MLTLPKLTLCNDEPTARKAFCNTGTVWFCGIIASAPNPFWIKGVVTLAGKVIKAGNTLAVTNPLTALKVALLTVISPAAALAAPTSCVIKVAVVFKGMAFEIGANAVNTAPMAVLLTAANRIDPLACSNPMMLVKSGSVKLGGNDATEGKSVPKICWTCESLTRMPLAANAGPSKL